MLQRDIMYKGILLGLVFIFVSCKSDKKVQEPVISITNNEIPIYNFESLKPLLYTNSDTIYVINFWAMWCAPCVKELPYFEELAKKYKGEKIEVLLVSLDFPKDVETKLKPFLKEKNINNKVVLLDDPDSNSWIDKIDPNWSGAIPFTIVFNKEKRNFFEQSFESLADLENAINENFNLK